MAEEKPKPSPWHHWESREQPKKAPAVLVRFTAHDGVVWTVWDTTFSKFKHHRRAHGDPDAKTRVFVNGAGVKRSYTFRRNESRVLERRALDRQLREAVYIGEMPNLSDRKPW